MIFTRQEPYVGEKYDDSTLLGVRVMVVGASHYCGEFDCQAKCTSQCKSFGKYRNSCGQYFGEQCQLFTINVIRRYVGKDASSGDGGWKRTYTKFLKSLFLNCNASIEDCRKLVEHLVFTEYLQGAEGKDQSDKNDLLFDDPRHYEALAEKIQVFRPDVAIVWGGRAWKSILKFGNGLSLSKDRLEANIGDCKVEFVTIPHPSQRSYYAQQPQSRFVEAGIRLVDGRALG